MKKQFESKLISEQRLFGEIFNAEERAKYSIYQTVDSNQTMTQINDLREDTEYTLVDVVQNFYQQYQISQESPLYLEVDIFNSKFLEQFKAQIVDGLQDIVKSGDQVQFQYICGQLAFLVVREGAPLKKRKVKKQLQF